MHLKCTDDKLNLLRFLTPLLRILREENFD